MELEFEEYLGPKGLKLGDNVKLPDNDTIYELITADGALYLYDAETCIIRSPLDLQGGFEKIETKKKYSDFKCDDYSCDNCPACCITCFPSLEQQELILRKRAR